MCRRAFSVVLMLSFLPAVGSAQAASTSPSDQAAAAKQATAAKQLHDEARDWKWTGAGLMIGGLVYVVLGETSLATERTFCSGGVYYASCQTLKDPNMGAVYGGVMMVGVGAVMMVVGGMKESRAKKLAPNVVFTKRMLRVQHTVTF